MIETTLKCGPRRRHMLLVSAKDVQAAWGKLDASARKNRQGLVPAICPDSSCRDHGRGIYIGFEFIPNLEALVDS